MREMGIGEEVYVYWVWWTFMGGCFGAGGRAGDGRRPSGCVDAARARADFLLGWGEAGNLALLAHVMPVLFRCVPFSCFRRLYRRSPAACLLMSFCERPYNRFLGVFWKAARIGTWTERLVVVSMGVVEGGCTSFMDPLGGLPILLPSPTSHPRLV